MTNHWVDLKNTDCALIIGSNAAENHPMSFKWLTKARDERGAKIISVDPRYTRTSSKADIYAPLRPGTDIAFIGGLINYAIENNLFFKDYVVKYTNAAFLINEGFGFKDGMFSGYDATTKKYDTATWQYQVDEEGNPKKDETLQNPLCVFQLLKKHYSRYTLDMVTRITGTPKEEYLKVAEAYCATGKPDKSGSILYAMGGTQHTVGSQNVRSYAVLQLLLGNIGVPGGGVNALRGESNVQGSTDMALLFGNLPGYLNAPTNTPEYASLEAYHKKETPNSGYWTNKPKFVVSLLKAWWGPAATKENEFAYHYLPKRDAKKNYSHIALFEAMTKGDIKGLFLFGQNPAVGGPNAIKEKKALEKLEWMVAVDLFETETAAFWSKDAGNDPSQVNTEVFFLPAAASYEKEGSVTNSGRWAQWRWKAVEPLGEARHDLAIIHQLALRCKEAYAASTNPGDKPIQDLFWNYGSGEEPDVEAIAKEISGYDIITGKQLTTFGNLKDDGSTASGCWIYGGMYLDTGNRAKNRTADKPGEGIGSHLGWGFSWPVNRRILYNRASADYNGQPWSNDKKVIWWDPTKGDATKNETGKWVGLDVPDFNVSVNPVDKGGTSPFIMQSDGVGGLFATKGMADGPMPEHYEPFESPLGANPMSNVMLNPAVKVWEPDKQGKVADYPIVATSYRVSEHWQGGAMTRNTPWLAELMPYMFVEISATLAKSKGIQNGETVKVVSARGEIEAVAMVTERLKPMVVDGKTIDVVGMPWHYGYMGIVTGSIANRLTPHIGDANTMIPEYKAFLCDVRKVK